MIKKIKNRLVRMYKIYILKDKFLNAHKQWVQDKGDETLRYNYSLNKDSIVFDLGGYHGEFAQKIYDKYGSDIYVFEPVKEYYEIIKNRFKNNSKIKVFNFGFSNKDETMDITLNDDGSSTFITNGKKETIALKSIVDFFKNEDINQIDLFKINIEGGEFSVLPELIKNDKIKSIKNLQIQFHNFIPNAEEMRENIRKEFSKTHHLTYDYYFIWENWEQNE
ncbi:FkbM family methyltransferase [Aliarcobacter cryaerophilus]|uniref:FkbM family methyltransferase n=1 Tax=Aliarcobacter cryaerophilus TaxID=28198 RepID=UPI003DA4DF56